MADLEFADVLRDFFYSSSQLAEALEIDIAKASRWYHNNRVPRLGSPDFRKLVEYLEARHLPSADIQRLQEAQMYSLRKQAEAREEAKEKKADEAQKKSPHAQAQSRQIARLLRDATADTSRTIRADESVPLRREVHRGVITNLRSALEEAVLQIETLGKPAEGAPHEILLSFQGENMFDRYPDLHQRWISALYTAIHRGWSVCPVWRLSKDASRSVHMVKDALALLGTQEYTPLYVRNYGVISPPYDMLIVPSKSAILFFATQNPDRADAAAVFSGEQDAAYTSLLQAHFQQLVAQANPLVKARLFGAKEPFGQAEEDEKSGFSERLLAKDGPGTITKPIAWFQEPSTWPEYLQAMEAGGFDSKGFAANRIQERNDLLQGKKRFRDICPQSAIITLVQDGLYTKDDALIANFQIPPERRKEHLEEIIQLLAYPDYELALLDEAEAERIPTQSYWAVMADARVSMQAWLPDKEGNEMTVNLQMTESTLVKAFHAYFDDLWASVARAHKDKAAVIRWLEEQVRQVEEKIRQGSK